MNAETCLDQPSTAPGGALCAWRRAALPVVALGGGAALVCSWALGAEVRMMAALGVAAGVFGCLIALWIEARAYCLPADAKGRGMSFQVSLALGFGVLFFGVAGSMLALMLLGLKFSQWSAFGLAFAGAAFILHVVGVFVLGRTRKAAPATNSACRVA